MARGSLIGESHKDALGMMTVLGVLVWMPVTQTCLGFGNELSRPLCCCDLGHITVIQ